MHYIDATTEIRKISISVFSVITKHLAKGAKDPHCSFLVMGVLC